jgi:hypothetical protein
LKQHKPSFDEEYSRYLDQRKEAKNQWVQDQNQSNIVTLRYAIRQASRHFGNREKECLKAKIDELETNSMIKHIRDLCMCISHFEKGYQPRTSTAEDEKSDLDTDCHSILAK